MSFLWATLTEAFLAVENLGGEALVWFHTFFSSKSTQEKIKQWRLSLENSGRVGLAKVLPPAGTGTKMIAHWFQISKPYLGPTVALAVLIMLFRFCGGKGGGGSVKTMKAPGRRNTRIPRAGFESNPRGYFRDLHSAK